MKSVWMRRTFLLLCGCSLVLLSGCFDYEETFHLEKDGSGTVTMLSTFAAEDAPAGEMSVEPAVVSSASVERHSETKEGKFLSTEKASFDTLDQLALEDRIYRIEKLPEAGRYRLSAIFYVEQEAEGMASEPGEEAAGMDEAAMAMITSMFAGHHFTASLEVPGKIVDAPAVKVGDLEVVPTQNESVVTFAMPMAKLFTAGGAEGITFTVDFEGDLKMVSNQIESVRAEKSEESDANAEWPVDFGEPMHQETAPRRAGAMGEAEKAYLASLGFRNVKVDRMVTPAEVSGEIKNEGQRTVEEIDVVVYCLDSGGQAMHEVHSIALGGGQGDAPLRPNYSKKFRVNLFDVASDWSGQVEVKIEGIRFGE